MKGKKDLLQRLTDGLDLPGEPLPGQPLIELAGDRRVLIENHHGVTQYGKDEIRVKVKYGQICVKGCGLELARMTKEQLIICGRIDCVSLLRRNG